MDDKLEEYAQRLHGALEYVMITMIDPNSTFSMAIMDQCVTLADQLDLEHDEMRMWHRQRVIDGTTFIPLDTRQCILDYINKEVNGTCQD